MSVLQRTGEQTSRKFRWILSKCSMPIKTSGKWAVMYHFLGDPNRIHAPHAKTVFLSQDGVLDSMFFFRTTSDEFWSQHLPTKLLMNAFEDWSRWGPSSTLRSHRFLLMVQKSVAHQVGRKFSHYGWVYHFPVRSFRISLQTCLTLRGDHHSSSLHHSGLRSNHWVQTWKSITPWLGSAWVLEAVAWGGCNKVFGSKKLFLPCSKFQKKDDRNRNAGGTLSRPNTTPRACKDSNLLRTQHQVWANLSRLLEQ